MRRIILLSLSVAVMTLGACSSKPKNGECKTGDDCKDQQGYGKVCVEGRCQECGADTDCQAGFVCRENKCAPRPECAGDVDCGAGKACQDGRCVAAAEPKPECMADAECGSGMGCDAGRCVTKVAEAAPTATCGGEDNAVLFAFDKADVSQDARDVLSRVADCLKAAPSAATVEGHADERGTTEYNLHLGERRAESVKKYLVNLGVDGASVKTTTLGEERPVCSDHQESCWAKNRRAVVSQ